MATLSSVGNPTVYNARTAQANATVQQGNQAAKSLGNASLPKDTTPVYHDTSTTAGAGQTVPMGYAKNADGTVRPMNAAEEYQAFGSVSPYTQNGGSNPDTSVTPNPQGAADTRLGAMINAGDAAQGQLANANNTYANKAAGLASSSTLGGLVQTASMSPAQQSAITRMRGAGLTDQQIRANLNNPAFNSRTDFSGKFDANGMYVPSAAEQLAELPAKQAAAVQQEKDAGGTGQTATTYYNNLQASLQEKATQDAKDQQTRTDATTAGNVNTTAGGEPTIIPPTPNANGTQGVTSNTSGTPASTQGHIDTTGMTGQTLINANLTNQTIDSNNQSAIDAKTREDAALALDKTNSDAAQAKLDTQAQTLKDDAKAAQAKLDAQNAADKAALLTQQNAELAQNQLTEQQNLMQASKDQMNATETAIAQLAMSGETGSSTAVTEMTAITQSFESKMQDIRNTGDAAANTINAKFVGMFQTAADKYTAATATAADKLTTALQTNLNEGLSNDKTRQAADAAALKDFNASVDSARKDNNTAVKDFISQMTTINRDQTTATALSKFRDASLSIRQQALDLAKGKAATANGQFDIKNYDGLAKQRDDMVKVISDDYKKTTGFADYTLFNGIQTKIAAVISNYGQGATAANVSMIQDLFAQFGVMKATSRQPKAMQEMLDNNTSLIDNLQSQANKISVGGKIDDNIVNGIIDIVNAMSPAVKKAAIADQQQYLLHISQYNQGVDVVHPGAPTLLKIDPATVFPSDIYTPPADTNTDPSQPDYKGILNGTTNYTAPTGAFSPSTQMKGGVSTTIGTRTVSGTPQMLTALQSADAAMFKATGQHLDINSDFRTSAQQQQAYNDFLSGKIARAAPPGQSLHEKGLAADITNWKQAEPFLIAAGLSPLGPIGSKIRSEDPAHFQLGSYSGGSSTNIADNSSDISALLAIANEDTSQQ